MPARSWIVGSLSECDIHIESPTVSGKHCRLTERGESFLLEDLNSTNGTFVDGQRIDGPRIVRRSDRVTLGQNVALPWPETPVAITVGRASDNDIVVPFDAVSGHHARVEREDGKTYLVDLGSTNGTAINDPLNKITRAPLAATDSVFLGTHRIAAVDLLVALPAERPRAATVAEQNPQDGTSPEQPTDDPAPQGESVDPVPAWAALMRSPRSWLIGIAASIVVAALILGGARLRRPTESEPRAPERIDDAETAQPSASPSPVVEQSSASHASGTAHGREASKLIVSTASEQPGNADAKPPDAPKPTLAASNASASPTADDRLPERQADARELPKPPGEVPAKPVRRDNPSDTRIAPEALPGTPTESAEAKPIEIAQAQAPVAPPTRFDIGKEVDLFPFIDPKRDSVRGQWKLENGELVSPKDGDTFLQIPVTPPRTYRFTIVGERDGGYDLFAGLPIGGHCVAAAIDANWRKMSGLAEVDGRWVQGNATGGAFNDLLGDKRTYTVICTVHPGSIVVNVNGMPVVNWVRAGERMSLPQHWGLAGDKLFVGGVEAIHRIRKLTLVALPEDEDIRAMFRNEGIVKLVYEQPLRKPTVGWDDFRVNWAPADQWPLAITGQPQICLEYIYLHAPSELVHELPKAGAKVSRRFTAVGYSMGKPLRYRVFASDQGDFATNARCVFESDPCRIVKIDKPLDAKDRFLLLQIDGDKVPAFWLHPTIHVGKKQVQLADPRRSPVRVKVEDNEKNDRAGINHVPKWVLPPLDLDEERLCDEFLFAHAPSEVTYAIPTGAVSFSAIGYCLRSGDVEFQVRVDNRPDPIFSSRKAAIAPIREQIPPGAKELRLSVSDLGNQGWDMSFWLYPRFHLATKKAPAKKPTARVKSK